MLDLIKVLYTLKFLALLLLLKLENTNYSYGEENGWRCKEKVAEYVWVLDPIDGTKSFITGIYLHISYEIKVMKFQLKYSCD